jgi:acyl-coenzyme A synthetase/AMP-(fatty) acid ligase
MHLDFLLREFESRRGAEAIAWRGQSVSYGALADSVRRWTDMLGKEGIPPGSVVSITGDFSPAAIALFLAMVDHGCIIAPILASANRVHRGHVADIAQVEVAFDVDAQDDIRWSPTGAVAQHELYATIRGRCHPGLVLFSSGSSGQPKGAVHDFTRLLEKFTRPRPSQRILNFLLFDHWGGLNTMLHTLSSGGTVLTVSDRSPEGICEAIERYKVEVLPASPTFLNLLVISQAYQRFDLSSLTTISYGTEPMAESTLRRLGEIFPNVKLQQTYGLIELGVLRSKSRSSDSLWVKIGGEGYETRVIDGLLQIRAQSAMLGYLNAPSPFTADGWFMTGDAVEVDGEYLRILGRKSELINVGGEKVYPQEVESVIQQVENVSEATVFGEKNAIVGNIVCAKITLIRAEDPKDAIARVTKHCRERLQAFKVPVKIEVVSECLYSDRFKKVRVGTP